MKLISFQKLGQNRESPRLWVESRRLNTLGFAAGTPIAIESRVRGVRLRPAVLAENHVSQRRTAGRVRPIIDVASRRLLAPLSEFSEIKVCAAFERIDITPSIRAFHIARQLRAKRPFGTVEIFSGGGTLSAAIASDPDYRLIAGVEIEPKYADVWQESHPSATLFQADLRMMHPRELPKHEVLIASIPCTSHSTLGRAKKSLARKPELGDSGDLFVSVANVVAHHLPLACVFENVPSFGSSLAGQTLAHHLKQLGYEISQLLVDPHNEWAEPQDRRRWVMVATLREGFELKPPRMPFAGRAGDYLDLPNEQDAADAKRIARTLEGLRRHNQRHREKGHGFGFTVINRDSRKIPTLVRSYHKINTGPFVETPFGPRLLRKHEAERLMGCEIACDHYATAIEILGQGVQTRVFREILRQVAGFLKGTL